MLVALLVALPVTPLALMSVAYRGDQGTYEDWVMERFGAADAVATVAVDPATFAECPECPSRADVEAVLPDGTRQVWTTEAYVPLRTPEQLRGRLGDVSNVDPTDPIHDGSYVLAEGAWPQADKEVAVDKSFAESLGVSIGDEFSLVYQEREFTMVGVIERGPSMVAPGFDFSVVRPSNLGELGRFDLPAPSASGAPTIDGMPEWAIDGQIELRPSANDLESLSALEQSTIDQEVILGWLGGVLAMSVLGVVVAAAFAISGRRQLVAVGQLSASGASQRTLARSFGLAGALAGAVGAAVGFLGAAAVAYSWRPGWLGVENPRVAWLDLVVIAATAVAIATVAALAPTRSLTRVSVLSALAGRRPVGAVPAWLNRVGLAAFIGGLGVTVIATRAGADGGGNEVGMLAAVGMIAAVLGVCALAPRIVDHLGGLAARRGGSVRLAARSTTRHRPRAAALLASLLVAGMAATGVAATVEHQLQRDEADRSVVLSPRNDLVWAYGEGWTATGFGNMSAPPSTLENVPALRAQAEQVVGPTTWTSASLAYEPRSGASALIGTDEVLDLLGLSTSTRAVIAEADGSVQLEPFLAPVDGPFDETDPLTPVDGPLSTYSSELGFYLPWALIGSQQVADLGWVVVPNAVEFGVTAASMSWENAQALWDLGNPVNDEWMAYLLADAGGSRVATLWSVASYVEDSFQLTPGQVRLLLVGITLLLMMFLLTISMALWAVESRDERDVLVAIGAPPATMARIAGWRAGGLTFGAMLISIPMGLAVAWVLARAARQSVAVPWLLVGLLLFAVPAIIGFGAQACSALAQKLRPVRMSTLSAE